MADIVNQPQMGGNKNMGLIIGLVVVAVALVGYLLLRSNNNQVADDTVTENSAMTENTTQNAQPAPTAPESSQTPTPPATQTPAATTKTFTVKGTNFTFAPSQIKVNKGDKVKIIFENSGGFHDLVIDEFKVKTAQIPSGQSETIEFIADKTGSFEYYCSVGTHRAMGMKGMLIVE